MRHRILMFYWLAVAVSGIACAFVPSLGWPFPAGAFLYLTVISVMPYTLRRAAMSDTMERPSLRFPLRPLGAVLAALGVVSCVGAQMSDLYWLGYGGAVLLFASGECVLRAWVAAGTMRDAANAANAAATARAADLR